MTEARHEVREAFANKAAFDAYLTANAWVRDPAFIASIAAYAKHHGVEASFGFTPPDQVDVVPPNYRESIVANGCNARARALLDELVSSSRGPVILVLEALSPLARHVRERFAHALLTEYAPHEADRARLGVTHCDIQATNLPTGSFDAVVSGDVLEHVPSLEAALRETRRILRPGGLCLATFPFRTMTERTETRAIVEGDQITHLLPPEYHGDPVRPEGALVFSIPSWDVLDLCRDVGFTNARMIFVSSKPRGITATGLAGVFMLSAIA